MITFGLVGHEKVGTGREMSGIYQIALYVEYGALLQPRASASSSGAVEWSMALFYPSAPHCALPCKTDSVEPVRPTGAAWPSQRSRLNQTALTAKRVSTPHDDASASTMARPLP